MTTNATSNNRERTLGGVMATDEVRFRRQAQEQLAAEVAALLERHDGRRLYWTGRGSDLMELLYCAFETGRLKDASGQMLTFTALVRQVCALLHWRLPRNPYKVASQARCRKGVRSTTYMQRYEYLLRQGSQRLLWNDLTVAAD